jgi:hypothetical protein
MVSALIKPSKDELIDLARTSVGSCSEVDKRLPQLEAAITEKSIQVDLSEVVTTEHMASMTREPALSRGCMLPRNWSGVFCLGLVLGKVVVK